jgi:hypothetical protein
VYSFIDKKPILLISSEAAKLEDEIFNIQSFAMENMKDRIAFLRLGGRQKLIDLQIAYFM